MLACPALLDTEVIQQQQPDESPCFASEPGHTRIRHSKQAFDFLSSVFFFCSPELCVIAYACIDGVLGSALACVLSIFTDRAPPDLFICLSGGGGGGGGAGGSPLGWDNSLTFS